MDLGSVEVYSQKNVTYYDASGSFLIRSLATRMAHLTGLSGLCFTSFDRNFPLGAANFLHPNNMDDPIASISLSQKVLRADSQFITAILAHEYGHHILGHLGNETLTNKLAEYEALVYQSLIAKTCSLRRYMATSVPRNLLWDSLETIRRHHHKIPNDYPRRREMFFVLNAIHQSNQKDKYQHPFLSTSLRTGQVTLYPDWQPVPLEAFRQAAPDAAIALAAQLNAGNWQVNVRQSLRAALAKQGVEM